MKLSRFAVLGFIAALAACNPILPPPPPGWNLELRAGTTNIDRSFFQNTDSETTRAKADEAHFQQLRAEILKKIPNFKLGSHLTSGFTTNTRTTKTNTRETYGLAVSLFLAVTKDGLPPKSDLSFIYSGPKGTYDQPIVYPAGNAWIAEPFVIPEGNGSYTFSSTLQDGTLAASVDLNLLDESKWLPLPQAANDVTGLGLSMTQFGNVLVAKWQAIPEAQSYFGLIYDKTDKKIVASFLTRNTQISSQDFVNIQDHVYSLDLVATNIDLTKDSAQSYGSLPENMKSSISSFDLKKIAPSLSITQTRMNLLVKPNQTNETVLKVENIGYGPLSFTTTISGNGLSIIPGKNDILSSKDTRDIHISGTCTNVDLIGTLTIKSNDPSNNTKSVPVILECDTPVSATLELQKLTHRYGIQSMQYSPDGKKIATTDSTEVIVWDALTGAVLHRFGASSNDVIKNSVYSLAWHSNSRSILVGMGNGIIVLDTETGLGGISVNLPSIAFSVDWNSDSSKFVVGVSGAAKIYNSTTGLLDLQISVPDGSSPSVNWSKSSNRLATAFSGKVYVWDTLTGLEINHYNALISKFDNYSSNALYSVSWNPTGDKLALFSNGSPMLISIWQINASNAELQIPITTNDPIGSINSARDTVWDIKWSPVNSEIAVILRKDLVGDGWRFINQIWDASNGALKTEFYTKSLSEQVTSSLAWSPDGSTILTQNIRSAFGWHVLNNENFLQLGFASGKISAMKMNSDASKLVISTIPDYSIGNLNLINIPSGSFLSSITVPRSVIALDWRKNTEEILGVLINTSGNNIVNSFDSTSGSVLNSYGGDFASVFSPDGQKIATMVDKSQVNILDASTKILLKTINLPACVLCTAYPAQAIVWSPDGKKIAVRIIDGVKIDVFDILSGSLIWERDLTQDGSVFQGNSIDRPTFLWSPDGKLISSGSAFFNALTGENFPLFERKFVVGGPIVGSIPMPLAWSADSRYLLTQDSTRIELRNATSGRIVTSIREIPNVNVSIVKADWNIQTNRFAFTDAQFSVYVYKFSQP